jgi:hypothetical protein
MPISHTIFYGCLLGIWSRSPSLERYFREKHPEHEYRSAGVNKYHTGKHGTNCIGLGDVLWSDVIVYAEEIHKTVTHRYYQDYLNRAEYRKTELVLNLGDYNKEAMTEYCIKAKQIINEKLYLWN